MCFTFVGRRAVRRCGRPTGQLILVGSGGKTANKGRFDEKERGIEVILPSLKNGVRIFLLQVTGELLGRSLTQDPK